MHWQTTYLSGNDRDQWNYLPGSTIDLAPKENPPSSLPSFHKNLLKLLPLTSPQKTPVVFTLRKRGATSGAVARFGTWRDISVVSALALALVLVDLWQVMLLELPPQQLGLPHCHLDSSSDCGAGCSTPASGPSCSDTSVPAYC